MNEKQGDSRMLKKGRGKAKNALIITIAIFIAAVILTVAMICCIPRSERIEAKSGNVIDVISYENGEWLYATSDGTMVRTGSNGATEYETNAVSSVKAAAGFENGVLRKVYKADGGDFIWGIVSDTDSEGVSWLFKAEDGKDGVKILDCVKFSGNIDNTFFLERDGYFYVACTGNQVAEVMRYAAEDIAAGTLCRTVLYDCSPDDDDGYKLRAVQMSAGIDCFDSDGEYLYILYDGGFIRLATDFSDVIYDSSKGKNYHVDTLDASKYISFGLYGVSSRGGAFAEKENRFYIADRGVYLYYFDTSDIDSLEIGEDMVCNYVKGLVFGSSPAINAAVYYDKKTEVGYVLHESSSAVTRVNFASGKIDYTFNLDFNIAKLVQGASANDVYYIYRNVNQTGQSEKTILAHTNAALKKNEGIFRGFMTFGICAAIAAATVSAVLGAIVGKHKEEQALKVVKKIWRQKYIYLALVPSLVLLIMFCYYEAIASIGLSFFDYTLKNPTMIWNNFANYKEVFGSSLAGEAFGNMFLFLIFDLAVALVPPLLFAFFLTVMKWKGLSNAVRTLLFITGVVPSVAGLLIWRTGIYGGDGVLNYVIKVFNGTPVDFLGQTDYARWAVLMIGFPFVGAYLIFYGGMMNISSSYYEAAELEGIGIWRRFFSIDIPLIVPQLKYVFITSFIHSLQNFARTYMVTGGQAETHTPIHIMYQKMVAGDYGLASAYATVIFVLLFFATYLNLRKQKKSLED